MRTDFEGKHVVITGGTGGLGGAVVALLAARGADVHVPVLEAEVPPHFDLAAQDHVHARCSIDLGDEEAVTSYYGSLPPLHASIHLAGGFAMGAATDTSLEQLRQMFDRNAVTSFLCSREAARNMRGHGRGGRIVNVAARPAVEPAPGLVAYATSKAAVAWMTRCLAAELAGDGIWVNAILPSVIDTPANREGMPDADFDRWPKPDQIAETIAFLASAENRLSSGALVPVYGRA